MADLFSKGSTPIFGGQNTGGWTVNAAGGAYIDDWVTIGVNGGIFQGTGTPASPTTALKIYNSSGIGLVEMWKAGVKTFYFDTNGDVTLSGTITATAGSIGGWTIGSGLLSAGSGSDAVGLAPGTYPFYAGNATPADAPFSVSKAGAIKATSGTIGGWTLASAYLADAGGTCGLAPADYPFYAGDTYANRASAEFRVSTAGALTATSATLKGSIAAASDTVLLNDDGVTIVIPEDAYSPTKAFRLGTGATTTLARLEGYWIAGADPSAFTRLECDFGSYGTVEIIADATLQGHVILQAESGAAQNAGIQLHSIAFPASNYIDFLLGGLGYAQLTTTALTLNTGLVVNENSADVDTRIEGNGDANLFFCDASTDRVGIGTNAPASLLDVNGELRAVDCILAQGTADDYILDLRSSDVAHGITYYADTSQYLGVMKASATNGGTFFRSFTADSNAFNFQAFYTTDITTKTTASRAPIAFTALKKNGADITTQGANANLAAFISYSTSVWIVDTDGDTWQNGSITAVGGFGCNSKAAQTAYALDAAISGTADGTYNATEQGLINSLVSQVNKLRAALVANGICS